MTYYAVQPFVYYLLMLLHFNGTGQPYVFTHHLCIHQVAKQESHCRCHHKTVGNQPPSVAEVESCHDEYGHKEQASQDDGGLLFPFLLPCVKPVAQEFRIPAHQDCSHDEHRHEEDSYEQPCLPIADGSCRQEQQ